MSFIWAEFLTIANYLYQEDHGLPQEAAFRSAVSRAYYAAFRHARDFAQKYQHYSPKGSGEDHYFLINHFKNRKEIRIGIDLDTLRKDRDQCDYDAVVNNLDSIAQDSLTRAAKIINSLNK
jgi:uncharacterized protein (UPF0332 family)